MAGSEGYAFLLHAIILFLVLYLSCALLEGSIFPPTLERELGTDGDSDDGRILHITGPPDPHDNQYGVWPTAAGVTYTYDGDGWRVKKSNGTLYWRGVGGEILAETNLSGTNLREFVYFAGRGIARREENGTVYYFFSDHLGTARVMTNATGQIQQESTYYPFGGEQRVITNTVDNRYKFM